MTCVRLLPQILSLLGPKTSCDHAVNTISYHLLRWIHKAGIDILILLLKLLNPNVVTDPGMTFGKGLPHFAAGKVVKGFGRGSKDLGIPTANFEPHIVKELPREVQTGIYFGWAQIDQGIIHKMVMSVGWNPYFKNVEKSMETHIMHKFTEDFYGRNLKVCMAGYLRPEKDYTSLEALIADINNDISEAEKKLEDPIYIKLKSHKFFISDKENSDG